jgi:hypothetical protein
VTYFKFIAVLLFVITQIILWGYIHEDSGDDAKNIAWMNVISLILIGWSFTL